MRRNMIWEMVLVFALCGTMTGCGCRGQVDEPTSRAGIKAVHVDIQPGTDGLTVEQRNIAERIKQDNKPGAVKHLYILSAYSGQCLIYSTVKGKVTSSGKRLTPYKVAISDGSSAHRECGFPINVGGVTHYTDEVLQDDGTYGSSAEYLFWFDSKGRYAQHYLTGGQIVHVSSEPIAMKSVVINYEEVGK